MLHADRIHPERPVDDFDCALMGVFGAALGFAFERAFLLERLSDVRAWVTECNVGSLSSSVASRSGASACRTADGDSAEGPRGHTLTCREVEVLNLMVVGDNTRRIAQRLFITEGTVKSHIKRIFRKLSVTSRAQAVAVWLELDR